MITPSTFTSPTASSSLASKKILLGISGGIAAYKCVELIRLFKKAGADVRVIMTRAAQEFITPLTLRTLSGNTVATEMFQQDLVASIEHIELARWTDLLLIAPATANCLAKLAHGLADDLLSTVCLATDAPLAVAPAMNHKMWHHVSVRRNVEILRQRGVHIFGPAPGVQACGDVGAGRMLEAAQLFAAVSALLAPASTMQLTQTEQPAQRGCLLSGLLHQRHVVITAGATQEKIDGVRYLSNYSSGKMGYALAQAAHEARARVTLISAPTHLPVVAGAEMVHVTTAQEMTAAVAKVMDAVSTRCDIFIAAAAVADYRPITTYAQKLKRATAAANITLELERTPDILAQVAALPAAQRPSVVVGFAAETENLMDNAAHKLCTKNVDMIVANRVGLRDDGKMVGFNCDNNEVVVLQKNVAGVAAPITLPLAPKIEIARELIRMIGEHYRS